MNLPIFCSLLAIILSSLGTLVFAMARSGAYPPTAWYIGVYAGFTLLFLLVIWKFQNEESHSKLLALIVGAVAARVIFCFAPVMLDTEILRIIFEGELMRNGLSPYLHPPADAEALGIQKLPFHLMPNSNSVSIYPPYAQYLFSVFAVNGFVWRLFIVACDIANMLLIVRILDMTGRPQGKVLYYAFLPLAFWELGALGHLEAVFSLCLLSFIYFSLTRPDENRWVYLGFFALSGLLVKAVSIIPTFFFLIKKNLFTASDKRKVALLVFIAVTLIFLPFLDPNLSALKSLTSYSIDDTANGGFQGVLIWLTGESLPHYWTKIFSVLLSLAAVVYILRSERSWIKGAMYTLALIPLLGPVFAPAHALWFAPLLCIFNSHALLYLALAIPLTYSHLFGSPNADFILQLVVFVPTWILLLKEVYSLKRVEEEL